MTTADRIRTIPAPDNTVNGSEKQIIPITVATNGSMVARMPALPASTVRNPSVYDRNGITAVTTAVSRHSNNNPIKLSAPMNLDIISAGRQIAQDPMAAITNVYVVTVYGECFLSAIVPKIL